MASSASAKIYQFPRRGRFAQSDRDIQALTALAASEVSLVPWDSWYHDEAIREEERDRKN